jgi:hypothetical protein
MALLGGEDDEFFGNNKDDDNEDDGLACRPPKLWLHVSVTLSMDFMKHSNPPRRQIYYGVQGFEQGYMESFETAKWIGSLPGELTFEHKLAA